MTRRPNAVEKFAKRREAALAAGRRSAALARARTREIHLLRAENERLRQLHRDVIVSIEAYTANGQPRSQMMLVLDLLQALDKLGTGQSP